MMRMSGLILILLLSSAQAASEQDRRDKVMDIVISEAIEAEFPPALALAVAAVGSDFEPEAVGHTGARGVMQLMPATALQIFAVPAYRLFDARTNVRSGIKYLKQLLYSYDDYIDIALARFYRGDSVGNPIETPQELLNTAESQHYVNAVLAQRTFYIKHPKVQAALDGVNPAYSYDREYERLDEGLKELVFPAPTVEVPAVELPIYKPTHRRRQNRPPLDVKARLKGLDDFSDSNSSLNQMLGLRQPVEAQTVAAEFKTTDAFDDLPAERQELVTNLRALRQYNLKR